MPVTGVTGGGDDIFDEKIRRRHLLHDQLCLSPLPAPYFVSHLFAHKLTQGRESCQPGAATHGSGSCNFQPQHATVYGAYLTLSEYPYLATLPDSYPMGTLAASVHYLTVYFFLLFPPSHRVAC